MKKIGIMGGTFDPVHNGHLLLGRQAYEEYGLDEIWFMPSHIPPHKQDHLITDGADRIRMLELALEDDPFCRVSDFEMKREGRTYTAKTLELLKEAYPDTEFYFILGADSLFQIETWYHPERVMALASFLAAGRDYESGGRTLKEQADYLKRTYGARIQFLHSPRVHVASEEIRLKAARGESLEGLVPAKVAEYIRDHDLYRKGAWDVSAPPSAAE